MEPHEKIEALKTEIRGHDHRYYVLAEPAISDEEYDALMAELEALERDHPDLVTSDSPTQRVGSDLTKDFSAIPHSSPMLSIANTYSEDEVVDFDRRIRGLLPGEDVEYVCELKIDGVAVALRYENGLLGTALTRGDGISGEEITANIRTVREIPLRLMDYDGSCEVRGEVFMKRHEFNRMNEERELAGDKALVNPRNATAGSLKLQDPGMVDKRPMHFFAYRLEMPAGGPETQWESLEMLKTVGFPSNKNRRWCASAGEIMEFAREMETVRDSLPYDIDGIVVKVDSHDLYARLGATAKTPRGIMAYKFRAKQAETVIEEITLQVGRTGVVTPVAVLKPVFLAGSTISRATLHNEQEIARKDIRELDTVQIEKGGDVIPRVAEVLKDRRPSGSHPFVMPEDCPVCGSLLVRDDEEVAVRCVNARCPAMVEGRIFHFASRNALDVEGLGRSLVSLLVQKELVHDYADLYSLNQDQLASLERMGEKSAANLLESLRKSRERNLWNLLYGLGIRHVGVGAARILADHFGSLDKLMAADRETLETIGDIGPVMAASILAFFSNPVNRDIVERLRTQGLPFAAKTRERDGDDTFFTGKTIVLTGELSRMTRAEASDRIREKGGKVTSSVSKNTDYLIAGANSGSKHEKALTLDVTVMEEDEFIDRLG